MVIWYRFGDNRRTGITVNRYARMLRSLMQQVWIPAIRRLMAAKSWKQQDLARASAVRPNTLTDTLAGTDSRISTFVALAKGLEIPLWALFCTDLEYAMFTDSRNTGRRGEHCRTTPPSTTR